MVVGWMGRRLFGLLMILHIGKKTNTKGKPKVRKINNVKNEQNELLVAKKLGMTCTNQKDCIRLRECIYAIAHLIIIVLFKWLAYVEDLLYGFF
jgi:hypothetical protein